VKPIAPGFLNDSATQFALPRDGENYFVHKFCTGDTCEIADSAPYIAPDRQMFIEKPQHYPLTGMIMFQGNGNSTAQFAGPYDQYISNSTSALTCARCQAPAQVPPTEHSQIIKRCGNGECQNGDLKVSHPNCCSDQHGCP